MGTMYERGWGVPKDLAEAYYWDRLALEYHTVYGNRIFAKRAQARQMRDQFSLLTPRGPDTTLSHE